MEMELATYNISFKWISGARNKAGDCLSRLVTPTSTSVNMLTASSTDGPAFHTRSHTQTPLQVPPQVHTQIQHLRFLRNPPLPQNHSQWIILEALLQMEKTDPFCKCISRRLLNGKHLTMNLTLLLTSKDSYTNMSQMLVKSFSLWSFLNLGNTQYLWKLMTNWVTKVIHAHIVLSNVNTIGKG